MIIGKQELRIPLLLNHILLSTLVLITMADKINLSKFPE